MIVLTLNQRMLDHLAERGISHAPYGKARWQVGGQLFCAPDAEIEPYAQILAGSALPRRFGAFSYNQSLLPLEIEIGRHCSLAPGINWIGGDHPTRWATTSPAFYARNNNAPAVRIYAERHPDFARMPPKPNFGVYRPVRIGNDVWIGEGAAILPGVTIGDGAVIGARTLVRRDVPPYAVAVGQPARVARLRFPEPIVERLLALRWWDYALEVVQDLSIEEPERFVGELEERLAKGAPRLDAAPPLRVQDLLDLRDAPAPGTPA